MTINSQTTKDLEKLERYQKAFGELCQQFIETVPFDEHNAVQNFFDEFVLYVIDSLEDEELTAEKYHYEKTFDHHLEHRQMTNLLLVIKERHNQGESVVEDLKGLIDKWQNHIQVADQNLKIWIIDHPQPRAC